MVVLYKVLYPEVHIKRILKKKKNHLEFLPILFRDEEDEGYKREYPVTDISLFQVFLDVLTEDFHFCLRKRVYLAIQLRWGTFFKGDFHIFSLRGQ